MHFNAIQVEFARKAMYIDIGFAFKVASIFPWHLRKITAPNEDVIQKLRNFTCSHHDGIELVVLQTHE